MGQIVPDAVERYLSTLNRLGDPILAEVARAGAVQNLPLIDAEVGGLLRVVASAIGAARILEIGTGIGYSGIWLAGALSPGGMLLTMELDADRARLARDYFARAGLGDRAIVMVGDATRLLAKVSGPFDMIFQDGDKRLYAPMLDRLVALLRPGGLLLTDNVLWDGEVVPGLVAAPKRNLEETRAIAEYNERLNADPRLISATIPLRDGVAIAMKKRTYVIEPASVRQRHGADMTIDNWLQAAIADAERRGLAGLKPPLESLAQATRALRAADLGASRWPSGGGTQQHS